MKLTIRVDRFIEVNDEIVIIARNGAFAVEKISHIKTPKDDNRIEICEQKLHPTLIYKVISDHFGLEDFILKKRKKEYVIARDFFYYLLSEFVFNNKILKEQSICQFIKQKYNVSYDRTTIIHSLNKINKLLEFDKEYIAHKTILFKKLTEIA